MSLAYLFKNLNKFVCYYSEPSLQRQHIKRNLLFYRILNEQIDLFERSCFVLISS